jgi:hypothetical protein
MSTTDLGVVEALLARALPDPRAFAERVLHQAVDRLAVDLPGYEPAEPAPPAEADAIAEDVLDRELLLAAAVGACMCWGEDPACGICSGRGTAGWTVPDRRLYATYVEPAVERFSAAAAPTATTPPAQPPLEGVTE